MDEPVIERKTLEKLPCPVYKGDFHWMREKAAKEHPKETEEFLKKFSALKEKLRASVPRWNK